MASFGESLRQERLRKQITLDEVAQSTKISQRFLQAIEEEKLQELPGGVFNRNFVRNYARFLGLDEEHFVDEYIRATGDSAQTSDLPVPPAGPVDPLVSGSTLLALLIAGVVALVIWAGYHLYREQAQSKSIEARSANSTVVPSPSAARTPAPRQLIAPPRPNATGHAAASPTQPGSASAAASGTSAMASASAPTTAVPPTPAGEKALTVAATAQPAWVSIYADGHWEWEGTLNPGEQKVVFFKHDVRVNSGNAGNTAVSIDGKPMGTLGKVGLVAHFAWPPVSPSSGAAPATGKATGTAAASAGAAPLQN